MYPNNFGYGMNPMMGNGYAQQGAWDMNMGQMDRQMGAM
jgi:hypothetical protein